MGAVAMELVDGFSNEATAAFRDAHALVRWCILTALQRSTSSERVGAPTSLPVTGGKRPERERGAPFFTINTRSPTSAPR